MCALLRRRILVLFRFISLLVGTVWTFPHLAFPDQNQTEDAQSALAGPEVSLEAVLTYSWEHNPTLQAARERLRVAQEQPMQVAALDDPVLTYEGFNIPENFNLTRTDNTILKLSQKFPFPGKRRLRREIASQGITIAEAELHGVEGSTRAEVTKAYYDLWQVHQNLHIYSREKELMAQFATIATKKYAVGQVSQPDVLRAQVELTRLVTRMTTETLRRGEVTATLNRLLSRPPEAPFGVPDNIPTPEVRWTLTELTGLALKSRPEIVAYTRAVDRNTTTLALAQTAYWPDFEVYIERFFNSGRKDGVGVIFSATIPLAYREKYDAGVAEARAHISASKADLRAVQDTILAEIKRALVRAQTAVELINLFTQTHIPQAEQALASSRLGYQTGKVDFLSLIDSHRVVEQVHLEHIGVTADFARAYADLERAVGQSLPRK